MPLIGEIPSNSTQYKGNKIELGRGSKILQENSLVVESKFFNRVQLSLVAAEKAILQTESLKGWIGFYLIHANNSEVILKGILNHDSTNDAPHYKDLLRELFYHIHIQMFWLENFYSHFLATVCAFVPAKDTV